VNLEELGVPTAMIITSEFVRESRAQSAVLGIPHLGIAVIDHPLSSLSHDQIVARAAQAVPQTTSIWLGKSLQPPEAQK
jgi:hypothetical protein